MRGVYILLLRLHPRKFRQRFGDEMLGIFEESSEKAVLMVDGVASLFRQWTMRDHTVAFSPTATADGVPLFYSAEAEVPRIGTLMPGALITLIAFGLIYVTMGHRWKQAGFLVGSHHPSPSHILGAHTDAKEAADLRAEVTAKPYPFHAPISAYFRMILVLGALDVDQDNVISAAEIENAPAALWKLDKNHDGKLSAEECGLKPDPNFDPSRLGRLRLTFMRTNPVLAVLDANQDGEIASDEIWNAAAALRTLDANRDGRLVERELLPDRASTMAENILLMLDRNGDGKISLDERKGPVGFRFRDILDHADRDGKGYVTQTDLALELGRR
jgi:Ca2+-binding EF-hand superfamily protein